MKYTVAAISLLAAAASAKKCQNITVPVTATSRNGVFNVPLTTNNIEVTNFILNLAQQGVNYSMTALQGYKTVSLPLEISATYCEPDGGASSAIQVLTHGIGFDKSYWDLSFNNYNYSYVDEAVDQYGFSTFAYDRPGIGASTHGNPISEIQALLEVDALKELTLAIKGGKISGLPKSFDSYTHIGHSFGSEHTYALTAMYPGITDCITLTGFSQNGSFVPYFEFGGNFVDVKSNPTLAPKYAHGYLAAGDASAVQTNFFAPGDFDPAILALAAMTGQPVTQGELLTIGGETGSPNPFPGPVHIVTGERDIPYCGGNCLAPPTGYPNIPSTSKQYFTKASNFKVDIIPGAGHGLNLEYSHATTYPTILNYLVHHGCAPKGHGGW